MLITVGKHAQCIVELHALPALHIGAHAGQCVWLTPGGPGGRGETRGDGAVRHRRCALLVGCYDGDGALHYAGKVGTGYTHPMLALLARKLRPLERASSPFVDAPRKRSGIVWVKPTLVAQARYNEMTDAGILRQPSFLGLRDDKNARDVRLEPQASTSESVSNGIRCAS